jgi:hypothetical protein
LADWWLRHTSLISALDTSTERDIQKALQNLVRGRSSLSIAHRLSTIANADLILVLKDGQIVEQGTHKELLEVNGVFAAMWADQISATGEPAVDGGSRDVLTGYQIDNVAPVSEPAITDVDAAPTQDTAELLAESSEAPVLENLPIQETPQTGSVLDVPAAAAGTQVDNTLIAFPSTNEASGSDAAPAKVNPVAFPTSDSAPIAFPGTSSDEAASQKDPSSTPQAPGITFAPEVGTPERSGTPDPDAEPKRKRISSQNFQRLARRISVTTRRAGSISNIPILGNLRRDTSSASTSALAPDDAGPSVTSQSPAASIQSEPDKDKSKKKEKKRRNFL